MSWIENIALTDVANGYHHEAGINSMLIRIYDPCPNWKPEPKYKFKEVHEFEFLDLEDTDPIKDDALKITDKQAEELVRLLRHALANHMNVVVHCVAGICRSGAIAEVGVMMGFNDAGKWRSPNRRVKHKMMNVLELPYNEEEFHNWRADYRKLLREQPDS